MKVSEITESKLAEYLRLEGNATDIMQLTSILEAAKAFVRSYTGLSDEQIDEHEDIPIAVYVLAQDMYDNRSMYVDKTNVNKVAEMILGMYCINLL